MNRIIASLLMFIFLFAGFQISAQESIDGAFAFQTNNAKKYSLYIPSNYDAATPNDLMLGLHPFNVNRWDGEAWRDTLINFAEENNLILVCPDGGTDGRIDGAIDTSFTTALMDSVQLWYNINMDQKYIIGFSVGGKTTYTYGLNHKSEYRGFIPIGAAVVMADINPLLATASEAHFYVIHGSQDSPNSRYTPIIGALDDNNACVEGNLLSGVGHTVDFNNRDEILTTALQYLKNNNCPFVTSTESILDTEVQIYPNPNRGVFSLDLLNLEKRDINIFDASGKWVDFDLRNNQVTIKDPVKGIYLLKTSKNNQNHQVKLMVL